MAYRPVELMSLIGKLRFARAQCFGRCGAATLNVLGAASRAKGGLRRTCPEIEAAIRWWRVYFEGARSRSIEVSSRPPLLIFTDGACEPSGTTVGALFIDPASQAAETFGFRVSDAVAESWSSSGSSQVIGQAEIFPVLISLRTWEAQLAGRRVLFFIDNDSARWGLVKGYSPILSSAAIIGDVWQEVARLGCWPWFARVPTSSNPGDKPSRLEFAEAEELFGAKVVQPVLQLG